MSAEQTQRIGKISQFYDEDTGEVVEDGTDQGYDFVQHGASVSFQVGEGVSFITIQTPNGKVIVKQIGKPA